MKGSFCMYKKPRPTLDVNEKSKQIPMGTTAPRAEPITMFLCYSDRFFS